jgi:curved DNA-binding protein CbpA
MPVPQLAEALYEAYRQRSSGRLTVVAQGRKSELLFVRGNLVGAEIRSGHRTLPQSLMLAGLIDAARIDSLWGDGQDLRGVVEEIGLQWTQACEIQTLSQMECLSAQATSVRFEAGEVTSASSPIAGERAVRAAWLYDGHPREGGLMFRCADPARCERWLLSDAERSFIRGFGSFKQPNGASPKQLALLELLAREGAMETAPLSAAPAEAGDISWADLLDEEPTPPAEPSSAAADSIEASLATVEAEDLPVIEVSIEEQLPVGAPALDDCSEPPSEADFSSEEAVSDDPNDPEAAARQRRQRLLRRAMENMGGLPSRPAEGVAPVSTAEVEPTPAPEPARSLPSKDEMAFVASLERKFYEIEKGADHFSVLGVSRAASADEIKTAFVELAKVFHPDRLADSLRHLSSKTRAVFESVRSAYETLQNDSRRESYVASLRSEAATQKAANPAAEASEAFKRGEALARKRDYAGAEEEFHRAYLLDAKASYLAAEGWAVYMDPARREQAPRAKQMISDAAKKDPNCDRAHYQLGVIARVEGDMDRAEKHFREVVRVNPRHLEANQELRLIQMRRKKGLIR